MPNINVIFIYDVDNATIALILISIFYLGAKLGTISEYFTVATTFITVVITAKKTL